LRDAAPGWTFFPDRLRDAALWVHGRRSNGLHQTVDGGVAVEAERRPAVRRGLPRGELLASQHAPCRPAAGSKQMMHRYEISDRLR